MVRTPPHPAYAAPDSPSRILEGYVDHPDSPKSWASAEDAAAAMYELVSRGKRIPIRVPLGADAWGAIKQELSDIDRDLEEIKEISFKQSGGVK